MFPRCSGFRTGRYAHARAARTLSGGHLFAWIDQLCARGRRALPIQRLESWMGLLPSALALVERSSSHFPGACNNRRAPVLLNFRPRNCLSRCHRLFLMWITVLLCETIWVSCLHLRLSRRIILTFDDLRAVAVAVAASVQRHA